MTKLISPLNGSLQTIHTQLQKLFYEKRRQEESEDKICWDDLRSTGEDNTAPNKICFRWETDLPESYFELSETEDFCKPQIIRTKLTSVEVGNLKVNQRYYWRVNGSASYCFYTDGNL